MSAPIEQTTTRLTLMKVINAAEMREAMGIDWMVRAELSQAIPPAYTHWIGKQLIDHLRASARGGNGEG